ncbi:polyamine aminopropyltransferase [Brevibacillus sp. NRS-1366]|uniref:polyamine aminopropyltransferase n=1 Tax=Brevibacillus sp. NRS-1366 TaxID=3233899 RepID=UPI003D1ECF03
MKYRESLIGYEKNEEELWLNDEVVELDVEMAYKISALLHYEQSKYQGISIAENKGFGRMLVLDDAPQVTAKDGFIYNEMIVHVPLVTHPSPKKVAIIGGGNGGAAREILKYQEVELVNVVEIDERVVEICRQWFPNDWKEMQDQRVQLIYQDGPVWLKEQKELYDVLLVDRADPYGPAQVLYKPAFYDQVIQSLNEEGIVVFQSGSPFYYGHILKDTYRNLKKLFPIVRVYLFTIPSFAGGIWSFTIASKKWDPLQANLSRLPGQTTKYITPDVFMSSFHLPTYVNNHLK